jgi:hypothetical protein
MFPSLFQNMMERLEFCCLICGQVRNSKKALKRHLRGHAKEAGGTLPVSAEPESDQRSDLAAGTLVADHCTAARVSSALKDRADANGSSHGFSNPTAVIDHTVNMPMHVNMANVPAEFNAPRKSESAATPTRGETRPNRRNIDVIVMHLKTCHMRDRTFLSRKSVCIMNELRRLEVASNLSWEILMGIIIAAKHFAGTQSPRMPAPGFQQSKMKMHSRSDLGSIRRKLFVSKEANSNEAISGDDKLVKQSLLVDEAISAVGGDEQVTTAGILPDVAEERLTRAGVLMSCGVDAAITSSSSSMSATAIEIISDKVSSEPSTATSVVERSMETMNDEEQWRLDIWRSYGTGEVKPPSPMGYMCSPSIVFTAVSPPEVSPVSTWSMSSDDEPWGPHSPVEVLEFDSQPEIPGWPLFADAEGQLLQPGSAEWQGQLEVWRSVRTEGCVRSSNKRRHCCRTRKVERQQYLMAMANRPKMTYDWDTCSWRPLEMSDIQLPSPPAYNAELLRTKRALTRKRLLPKGCRIQPSRKTKYPRLPVEVTSKLQLSDQGSAGAFELSPQPEIILTVSDEEL